MQDNMELSEIETVEETVDTAEEIQEEAEQTEQRDADRLADALSLVDALNEQVRQLTEELEKKEAEAEIVGGQIREFFSLFPNTAIESVPESVWESVKQGNSLAAAYALHHRRIQLEREKADRINEKNATLSAGKAGRGAAAEYFTPAEVRAMSQLEVRANYSKIIESMKKWN